jgi:hypothetical protein
MAFKFPTKGSPKGAKSLCHVVPSRLETWHPPCHPLEPLTKDLGLGAPLISIDQRSRLCLKDPLISID